MPPAGFEPAIPASERPQTNALDRAATRNGVSGNAEILYRTSFLPFSVLSVFTCFEKSHVFKPRDIFKAAAARII
jgi:hypothetical protein